LQLIQGVFHTLSGGLITPTFAQHPPASGGKEEERGREGRGKGKGRGEGKGRDPQGLVDTPMFQILKNTLSSLAILLEDLVKIGSAVFEIS